MDVFSQNRSRLNTKRIDVVSAKTIVFYLASIPEKGASLIEIPFPHEAVIENVTANCVTTGSLEFTFDIEKCSGDLYGSADEEWVAISADPFKIPKDTKLLSEGTVITENSVAKDTYFRINIINDTDVGDITININCILNNNVTIEDEG